MFHKKNCKSAIIPIDADTCRDYNYIRELITMAELPGNVHEKIGDLRIERDLTKKQVSEGLGIPASQLTRIENEDIKSIGHELVIKFADYFGVSTDYLLGKTSIRAKKNVELDELGLSHKALVTLMSGKVNMQLLSRIIEHKYFIPFMDYAEAYFESAHEEGFLTRNSVIDLATADISEYMKTNPSHTNEGRKDIRQLNAQKVIGTEADLEKLKSLFLRIMKDVKEKYAEPSSDISGEEMREQIQKVHDEAISQKKNLTEVSMAGITTQMISSLGLSEENMQAFQELMVNILKDSGNKNNGK